MIPSIDTVYIYQGNRSLMSAGEKDEIYRDVAQREEEAFCRLRTTWKVEKVFGEKLLLLLGSCNPKKTLLVIPAAPSSHLEKILENQMKGIENFARKGGFVLGSCGAAYLFARIRTWHHDGKVLQKKSPLSIFPGEAEGPLCPRPSEEKDKCFRHVLTTLEYGEGNSVTVLLSGGGIIDHDTPEPTPHTLANYKKEDLDMFATYREEYLDALAKKNSIPTAYREKYVDLGRSRSTSMSAVSMYCVGEGVAILMMPHPYLDFTHLSVEDLQRCFPEREENWDQINAGLSSLEERLDFMRFVIQKAETQTQG